MKKKQMHLYRRVIAVAALMAIVTPYKADAQKPRSLEITHTDGTHISVALSSSLTMQFSDEALLLSDSRGALDVSVPRERLASFALSEDDAGTETVASDQAVSLRLDGATLSVVGLNPGSAVSVLGVDGRLVKKVEADDAGIAEACLSDLSGGICLVRINGSVTYKVTVR